VFDAKMTVSSKELTITYYSLDIPGRYSLNAVPSPFRCSIISALTIPFQLKFMFYKKIKKSVEIVSVTAFQKLSFFMNK
jgi:hypothetical protein